MPINENKPSSVITWAEILKHIKKHRPEDWPTGNIINEIRMVEKHIGDNFSRIDEIIAEAVATVLPQFHLFDLWDEKGNHLTTVWCHPYQLQDKMRKWQAVDSSINEGE